MSEAGKRGVTVGTAAEILGVSVSTLRSWDRDGKLKALRKKNGYRYYNIGKLEKFARKHRLSRFKGKLLLE